MGNTTYVSIKTGTIVKIIALCAVAWGLYYIRDFVLVLLVAVVLASSVEPPVTYLTKHGIPRALAVGGMMIIFLGIIAIISFMFIPPLADDLARFIQTLPKVIDSVRIFGRDLGFKDLAVYLSDLSRDISKGQILTILKAALFGTTGFFATTSIIIDGLFHFVLTFVIAFYIALEEKGVLKFLQLLTPKDQEVYMSGLWLRAQRKIALWMQGQFLLSALVALLVYIPMLVLNMPYAALLAILAFVGELVPMVGLTFSTIPALFIAWSHGGVSFLGIVALIYFVISQLESHVLYPKVMNKMVGVPSVIVIIAIVIGAKLAGIWGVLLAVPLASVVMELVADIRLQRGNNGNHG